MNGLDLVFGHHFEGDRLWQLFRSLLIQWTGARSSDIPAAEDGAALYTDSEADMSAAHVPEGSSNKTQAYPLPRLEGRSGACLHIHQNDHNIVVEGARRWAVEEEADAGLNSI